jgi:putative hemolysin
MNANKILFTVVFVLMLVLTSCSTKMESKPIDDINEDDVTQIANPASKYCAENDGTLSIIETLDGQIGICEFENEYKCEEWAYFRGECSPDMHSKEKIYCTPESKQAQMCTMEYMPVCGYFYNTIQCIKAPCAITASNKCMACANENVEFYVEGECPIY